MLSEKITKSLSKIQQEEHITMYVKQAIKGHISVVFYKAVNMISKTQIKSKPS